MRKYIVIFSALFLFSAAAHADVIGTKEIADGNPLTSFINNDAAVPVPRNDAVTESKQAVQLQSLPEISGEKKTISKGNVVFQYEEAEDVKSISSDIQKPAASVKTAQVIDQPAPSVIKQAPETKTPAGTASAVSMPVSPLDQPSPRPVTVTSTPNTAQVTGPAMPGGTAQRPVIRAPGSRISFGNSAVQPGNAPSPAAVPTTSTTETKPSASSMPSVAASKPFSSRGSVSLNFDDADVYSVIQTVFSEILKVNYIVDPKVKGRVTFRSVAPVPRENVLPLMEVILRLNGVAVVEENNLYRIIPISELAREPSTINTGRSADKVQIEGKALMQVVPINYLQSSEVIKLITPFASANAVLVDVVKINHIIIVDTDANVKHLLQLIEVFDSERNKSKGPQVFVHHVQNGNAKDITALLQQIFLGSKSSASSTQTTGTSSASTSAARQQTQQIVSQGRADALVSDLVKIYADEVLNAIIILGTPEDYDVIKATIVKLDIVPRQVLIEGTIASVQLIDKMSLGLAWSLKTNLFNLETGTISFNPSALSAAKLPTDGLALIGIDSGDSIRVVINALASKSKAKLLASPHIMVSDNREARIQVGQQVPLVTSETYGTSGTSSVPIRTIQYKDIGMILKVKPQINDSGLVTMEISQEVSTYTKDTLYTDETQIILNKTEATTNLVVQDGHTIVIGGLIREDDSKARQGIPFIYKIPLLGYLFGNTDNEGTKTEIVILLTPHVVKNQQEASAITNEFTGRVTDKNMSSEIKKSVKVRAAEPKKAISQ